MTRPTHRRLLATAVLALLAPSAFAQGPAPLDDTLAAATQLSSSQRDSVDAYADGWAEVLRSRETEARAAARKALLAPLASSPTPAFRIQYGSGIKDALTRQAGGSAADRLFAAELAGRLATVDAHAVVLSLLHDGDSAVRYAAARAARNQLESIDSPPAALNDQHRERLIDAIADQIAAETNPLTLDGLLTTATEAVIRNSPVADAVLERHSAAAARNLQADLLDGDLVAEARATLRLVAAVQQRYRMNNALAPNVAREGGLLAGSALGFVLNSVENEPEADSPEAADALEQLAKSAHNLAFFAASVSGVRIQPDEDLPRAFEQWRTSGDTRSLRSEIEEWIGPGGVITRPPFSAAPGDFPGL